MRRDALIQLRVKVYELEKMLDDYQLLTSDLCDQIWFIKLRITHYINAKGCPGDH